MKQLFLTLFSLVFLSLQVNAQFRKGNVELSLSGGLGSWTSTSSSYGYDHSDTRGYFLITFQPGYYVIDGLSLACEIDIFAFEKMKPAQIILADISYTFRIPESKVAPFARIGYGISNATSLPGINIISRMTDEFDIGVFNAGIGLKIPINQGAALKLEINYKSYSWSYENKSYYGTYKYDNSYSGFGLLFGFSVLL